ncbi:MAG: hypothetical protein K2N56_05220 [Oscillospiraceae bacterium]|nr:hypothetical protein [Oscillospiraceae bacterium]
MKNDILENSISNIDDDLIEMTAQKLLRTSPRKTALKIVKFAGRFAGIAAVAAVLCVAVQLGIKQYNDRALQSGTVSGSDPASSGAGNSVSNYDPENSRTDDTVSNNAPETPKLDFKAQNIRTNAYYDPDDSYPKTVLIKDRGELEKYYVDNADKYNLRWDDTNCFYQAVSGYDEEFFKDHCLLFVIVQEGSGSIGHDVRKVEYSAENNTISITIDRIVPNIGTDDMAEWHIVIELDARYGGAASVNVTQNTLAVDLAPEPDTDQDPFFSGNGVSYAEIIERGFEKDLGFKVKNTENFPGFQKYLPSLLYHDSENGDACELTYVFNDHEISASRYDDVNHPGLFDKESLKEYDYKGYIFYKHPSHTNLVIFYDGSNVVYYCLFADPRNADAVRDRIIEIINVSAPEPVDPDNKPDFFSGEKDCSYADILNRGYENSLGFKVKNMEQRPDFKKYSAWLMYPGTGKERAGSITYVFADHSITACKYDEGIHPDFLDKDFIEQYDYKGITFSNHPSHPDYIVFFDENDTAYYCCLETPDDADAARDLIIEIVNE